MNPTRLRIEQTDRKLYKHGDRVKLKWNRRVGTVIANEMHGDANVHIQWDHNPQPNWEHIRDLETVWAPRDTDPVNPNQEAIDAIEVQRKVLIKQVDELQARLGTLTRAQKLLERG